MIEMRLKIGVILIISLLLIGGGLVSAVRGYKDKESTFSPLYNLRVAQTIDKNMNIIKSKFLQERILIFFPRLRFIFPSIGGFAPTAPSNCLPTCLFNPCKGFRGVLVDSDEDNEMYMMWKTSARNPCGFTRGGCTIGGLLCTRLCRLNSP